MFIVFLIAAVKR